MSSSAPRSWPTMALTKLRASFVGMAGKGCLVLVMTFSPPSADAHLQLYIMSKLVKQRYGKLEAIDVSIPFIEMREKESIDSFMERVQEASFDMSISRTVSDKLLSAESHAINSLVYPPGSDI